MAVLHGIFVVFKFIFGLGALLGLVGIGVMLLWFALHLIARFSLRHQPADQCVRLRRLFLEARPPLHP